MKKIMQKGFTLVELLIVIALLGALAIGLIGALDPFEQLKKGTDTGTRNTVSEIQAALIRYYALKGFMPWCTSAGVCPSSPAGTKLNVAPMVNALVNVMNTGELKSNFTTVQSGELGKVWVTTDVDNLQAMVCYKPTAKSFQSDLNTVFKTEAGVKDDAAPLVCKSNGGATDCWWCVQ